MVKNWMEILKNISVVSSNIPDVTKVFQHLLDHRFYDWMLIKVFDNFANFMFMANENFERLEGYYEIINKPVAQADIEHDYMIREWNSSKCLAVLRTYVCNVDFQQSVLIQLIQRGSLIQIPYCMLQKQHLLFYYHLARIENKDANIPKEGLLSSQTISELIQIIDQVDTEKYHIPKNYKFQTCIRHFEVLGQLLVKDKVAEPQVKYYEDLADTINAIANNQGGRNQEFFKKAEEFYESLKTQLNTHPNFKHYFEKMKDLIELSSDIEIEANKYVTIIKTIIAAIIVQTDSCKKEFINKIVRPLMSTIKNDTISKIYQKLSSKALVKILSNPDILSSTKDKIVKCVLGYITLDPDACVPLTSFKTERKLKYYNELFDRTSSYIGANAFFYNYAKVYHYENILEANEGIVAKTIQKEYDALPVKDKTALVYTPDNKFYTLVMKLRTLMHIWRDMNSKLKIKGIEKALGLVIEFLESCFESDKVNNLMFLAEGEAAINQYSVTSVQAQYLRCIPILLGEVLAKNLVDRKKVLEFIFKLIDVDQPDDVLKEIGRDTIDVSLKFAEDDESVDFFKYLP